VLGLKAARPTTNVGGLYEQTLVSSSHRHKLQFVRRLDISVEITSTTLNLTAMTKRVSGDFSCRGLDDIAMQSQGDFWL